MLGAWLVVRCWLALLPVAASGTGAPEYDSRPFLQALSPAWQKDAARRMGLSQLAELPLYQMEIRLRPIMGELSADITLNFKNRTGRPLEKLVLRVLANTPRLGPEPLLSLLEISADGFETAVQWPHPTTMALSLSPALAPGGRVLVNLKCNTKIPRISGTDAGQTMADLMAEESRAGYGILGQGEGVFNLALFYPLLAAWGPQGWDMAEPTAVGDWVNFDPANYLVKLILPRAMQVASSGFLLGSLPLGDGPEAEQELSLMATAVRHFALQASTRYTAVEKTSGGVRLRALVLDDNRQLAEKLLGEGAAALQTYGDWLGPYPFNELELAEAPLVGGAGGMEYPGLVTLASLLGSPQQPSDPLGGLLQALAGQLQAVEFVVAHEVAHQWFHVQVGSDSGRHPFLDEATVNYLAVMFFEKRHGASAAEQQLYLQMLAPLWMWQSLGGKDGPVDRPAKGFSNQLEYTAFVYGKGALFFHALRLEMKRGPFLRCLRGLAGKYAFRRLTPDELRREVGACHPRGEQLYRHWIEETHLEEDLEKLGLSGDLERLLGQLGGLDDFHNFKFDGTLPPETLQLFEDAIRQLSGGP